MMSHMSLAHKIMDALPEGTRPGAFAFLLVSGEFARDPSDAIKLATGQIFQRLHDPCRVVVVDTADLDPLQDAHLVPNAAALMSQPGAIVYGFTLGAIPGKLPYVVVRDDAGAQEGHWLDRTSVPAHPLLLPVGEDEDTYRQVVAETTGEVEVREDGAMAEVYRVAE